MSYKVFLGVDGGATKTVTVCVDTHRHILGRHVSGSSNHNSVGDDNARSNLVAGIEGVLKESGRTSNDVGGITLSMAGVDRPQDKELVSSWISSVLPNASYSIHNDAVAALASGTDGVLYGVVVISGTGMIAYGFKSNGESARAGGWGPLLGDEGSGYHIGSEVLKAVARAKDGMIQPTQLTNKVFSFLSLQKEEDLITWAYTKNDEGWQRIAQLSSVAHEAARDNDIVAKRILTSAASSLVDTIQSVVRQLDIQGEFPLVMAGGNLDHDGSVLASELVRLLAERVPKARPTRPKVEPALGAGFLAVQEHQR